MLFLSVFTLTARVLQAAGEALTAVRANTRLIKNHSIEWGVKVEWHYDCRYWILGCFYDRYGYRSLGSCVICAESSDGWRYGTLGCVHNPKFRVSVRIRAHRRDYLPAAVRAISRRLSSFYEPTLEWHGQSYVIASIQFFASWMSSFLASSSFVKIGSTTLIGLRA